MTTQNSKLISRNAANHSTLMKIAAPEKNQLFVPIEHGGTTDNICFSYCCGCFMLDSHIMVGKL